MSTRGSNVPPAETIPPDDGNISSGVRPTVLGVAVGSTFGVILLFALTVCIMMQWQRRRRRPVRASVSRGVCRSHPRHREH
jgi:hypothetical protein